MDCTDLAALLSGLLDDEVDPALRHAAERHMVECERCRTMVARAESLDAALRSAAVRWGADSALPPAVVDSVMAQTVAPLRAARRRRLFGLAGWFAAAAAMGLAATAWLYPGAAPQTPTVTGVARTDPAAPRNELARREGEPPASSEAPVGSTTPAPPGRGEGKAPVLASAADRAAGLPRPPSDGGRQESAEDPALPSAARADAGAPAPRSALAATPAAATEEPDGVAGWTQLASSSGAELPAPRSGAAADDDEPESDLPAGVSVRQLEEDAGTLFTASILLSRLASASTDTFADVDHIRDILAYDGLLDRLASTRQRLPVRDRHAIWGAESILLRLERGPLSQEELEQMKEDLLRSELHRQLDELSLKLVGRKPA